MYPVWFSLFSVCKIIVESMSYKMSFTVSFLVPELSAREKYYWRDYIKWHKNLPKHKKENCARETLEYGSDTQNQRL